MVYVEKTEITTYFVSAVYRAVRQTLRMEGCQVPRETARVILKELDTQAVEAQLEILKGRGPWVVIGQLFESLLQQLKLLANESTPGIKISPPISQLKSKMICKLSI